MTTFFDPRAWLEYEFDLDLEYLGENFDSVVRAFWDAKEWLAVWPNTDDDWGLRDHLMMERGHPRPVAQAVVAHTMHRADPKLLELGW